jgi:hypothetical protein
MSSNYCLIKDKNNKADINGYGSVGSNFLIQRNFITYKEYLEFLNILGAKSIELDAYNTNNISIIHENNVFQLKDNIDPNLPVTYINLKNLQQYCNWLNHKDINLINEYPYNVENNSLSGSYEYWIPTYNQFYKSAYYNPSTQEYHLFPNHTNSIDNKTNENHISPYGLMNAGFKYFNIIYDDKNTENNQYKITGGSYNRHPNNAKAGTIYYVAKDYISNYISGRLCKKLPTYNVTVKLYDTYGDGWQNNYITIKDQSNNVLLQNISLDNGYGPLEINLQIDILEKYISIEYVQSSEYHYENYYEVYLDNQLIFKSNQHETPPKLQQIPMSINE